MNDLSTIGHNNPPDPIDEAIAPFASDIEAASEWLDGDPITTEDQMRTVDAILAGVKKAATAVSKAKKDATAPLYDIYKAEGDRWKPTEADLKARKDGLIALIAPLKKRIADEKEAAIREAARKAREADNAARQAVQEADPTDLKATADAQAAIYAADDAKRAAQAARKDTEKGLRLTWFHEIDDMAALVRWIAKNDKSAMAEFATEYARRNHRDKPMDGVRAWQDRVAS